MTPIAVHKAAATGLFRTSVFFVFAAGAFAERDDHTRSLLLVGIFLLDVVSWHLCEVVNVNGHLAYNQTWFNVLPKINELMGGRFWPAVVAFFYGWQGVPMGGGIPEPKSKWED